MNTAQNPSAFPAGETTTNGMSLLDYFAGQAWSKSHSELDNMPMDRVATRMGLNGESLSTETYLAGRAALVAEIAYDYASAMLAERTKRLNNQ